ncbi:amidase signature enzyme [Rickenella mellea]|uniref:Glutamyl-tRNA(Gln) amidotransferase subunit A, mitochondrial n=1 Tax=Rickenella mellea TaxID=50990 RepID=A0A4Y7Q7S3_9AGAM|nr:amidase signature enzyme [Rickenella mellea]
MPLESVTNGTPLTNKTIAIKDNICTTQFLTTCGSRMLQNFRSPYDATVVRLLEEAGAHITGKTNCDEFGMGSANIHSIHGTVVNPHQSPFSSVPWHEREERSPGGSSGGSAAAVAAGMCDAAIGTDTGGSVRLPASYCGVAGFKPSYGMISRLGVVSYADSLDCVGILAKTTAEIPSIYSILSVFDERDPTSARPEIRKRASDFTQELLDSWDCQPGTMDGLTIGIPQEYFPKELNDCTVKPLRQILDVASSLGAKIVPLSLPMTQYALSAYYVIASAEASSNMARYDGIQYGTRIQPPHGADTRKVSNVYAYTRSHGFGHEVQKRILLGTYALTADAFDNYFLQAQRIRRLVTSDFDSVFRAPNPLSANPVKKPHGVDVLLHPSAVGTAPFLSDSNATSGLDSYVQDVLTAPASLAGLPALSVPAGLVAGWPVGVSIVGQWGSDELVLKVGQAIEQIVAT